MKCYYNGNAFVRLYENGTRILDYPDDEKLNLQFPLSMDFKITNWCDEGCPMCHENSNCNGAHGDIMNLKFVDSLHSGTEIALGGGKVTSHPDLIPFLEKLSSIGVFASITVHQNEFLNNEELIRNLINKKLVWGVGISYHHKDDDLFKRLSADDTYRNVVIHTIAGYHSLDVFEYLSEFNLKILILGYKHFRRGNDYYNNYDAQIDDQIKDLDAQLPYMLDRFKVVSFDNLALSQLNVKKLLTVEEWTSFYQGNDGTATFYIDGVNKTFARTSTSVERYDILDNIENMFQVIKNEI